jgi:hypothetical protein
MIFLGGMAFGYSQGFALAIRRQSSRNYRLRADGDDHLRAEEKGAALLRSRLSADSGDCGRGFRLIADSDSDRSRTAFR